MHFSNILEDDVEYNVIECTKLDNNILLVKERLDKNAHNIVKLKENQCAILFEEGKVLDLIKEDGVYSIKSEPNSNFLEEFNDYHIKDNKDPLSIIFFNTDIITNNKFYIKKKRKNEFFGDGDFEFIIKSPLKFFNKVIDVKSYYSREELLEQIRERISKAMTLVIKDNDDEYIIDEEYINKNINIFEEYGIKIIACDAKNIQFKKK